MSLPATSHRSSAMNPLPITESHKAVDWTAAQRSDDIHQKHPNMAGRREQLRLGSKVVVHQREADDDDDLVLNRWARSGLRSTSRKFHTKFEVWRRSR